MMDGARLPNAIRWRRPYGMAVQFVLLLAGAILAPLNTYAGDCQAGLLVTVVAHLDDDLLFVNPGISDKELSLKLVYAA